MSKPAIKLSDLQISVMKVLWLHGKLSVNQTHRYLNQSRELALTTVATLLKRMQEKGIVGHEKQGRQYLYYALVSENEVKTSMLGNLLTSLFDGKPEALVHHLVAEDDVAVKDLEKIKRLLQKDQKND